MHRNIQSVALLVHRQKTAILSCVHGCAAAWESKEAFLKYIKKEDTKGRQICKYIQVLHSYIQSADCTTCVATVSMVCKIC